MLLIGIAMLALGRATVPIEAELTWHEVTTNDSVIPVLSTRIYGQVSAAIRDSGTSRTPNPKRLPGKAPEGYSAPAGAFQPAFVTLGLGSDKPIVAVATASSPSGPIDRVWVDWNANKRFEESEAAKLSTTQVSIYPDSDVFEYQKPPAGVGGPVHVKIVLLNHYMVALIPTGYMMGNVKIAGNDIPVDVFDRNFNGTYGDVVKNGMSDELVLDSNLVELPALIKFADNQFWEPTVAKNGKTISFTQDAGSPGTVTFSGETLYSVSLYGRSDRRIIATPVENSLVLPGGECGINASFAKIDSEGKRWSYSVFAGSHFRVKPGVTQTLQVGGPLTLSIEKSSTPTSQTFQLNLKDHECEVKGLYDEQGRPAPVPQLTIKDAEGKIVKTMPFAYG